MTRAEMMERMSYRELVEHQIDYQLEPWGDLRTDIRVGGMIAPLLNLLKALFHKNPDYVKASDWFWKIPPERTADPVPAQSPVEMKNILMGLAKRWGAKKKG